MNEENKTYPQPHCPNCNSPLKLIVEKNDWFCEKCGIFPKTSNELKAKPIKGSDKGNQKFWIISGIIIVLAAIWFIYQSFTTYNSFLQSFYLVAGIIAIGGYLGSILLLKLILKNRH